MEIEISVPSSHNYDTAMPRLAKLLLASALLVLANADDADMKRRIKLKTTRQLNEMLSEAGVEAPAGADKETLRDLVFDNDALTKYEEKHPPTPRPGGRRGAGGGGGGGGGGAGGGGGPSGPDMKKVMFMSMDKDKDGKLTREEMQAIVDKVNQQSGSSIDLFTSLDANSDGFVDDSEIDELFKKMGLGGGGGGGGGGGAAGGAQAGGPAQSAETMFKYLDKDKDGKLSQAEMASTMEKANAAAKARGEQEFDFFEKLDVDNDGFVDRGEADEFFKMMGLPTGKEEL